MIIECMMWAICSVLLLKDYMTDKGDKLDKFNSIATIFKSKYKMTIEGMIRFVKDKVDSPE